MLTFWTYLWKEWRDHAKTVYVFWGLLIAVTGILSFALPFEKLESGAVPSMLVAGSMMLAVALIGAELVPGDSRRGTLQFLARTPAGLHTAFWAKLTFAVSTILLFGLSAWLVSGTCRVIIAPDLWKHPLSVVNGPVLSMVAVTLVAALWVLAISCWVPNGLLAIPALGLLTIPYWIWWFLNPVGRNIYPVLDHFYWQPVLALGVAWLSFVVGRRFGRSGAWSGSRGMSVAVLGSMPFWICLWSWHVDYRSFDPNKSRIRNAWLGKNGNFVFMATQRQGSGGKFPNFPVRLDLGDGSHEVLGPPGSCIRPIAYGYRSGASANGVAQDKLVLITRDHQHYIDTASGRFVRNPSTQLGTRETWERTALQNATTWRTTDGRRAWMLRSRLEYETKDGGVSSLEWQLRNHPGARRGFGLSVQDPSSITRKHGHLRYTGVTMFDLDGMRLVTERPISHPTRCWVLGDRWLLGTRVDQRIENWRLMEHQSGREESLHCMRDGDSPVTVLDQHRLIVLSEDHPNDKWRTKTRLDQRVFLVSLRNRSRTPMRFADPRLMVPSYFGQRSMSGGTGYGVGPGDHKRRLFRIADGRWVTLAPDSMQFTKAFPAHRIVGFLDDTRLLVTHRSRIVEINVETGQRRVVFPREDSP